MVPATVATGAEYGVELLGTSSSAEDDEATATREREGGSCFLEWLPVSCWSIIVDLLAARDILCLSLTSKTVWCLLGGVAGLWTQACGNTLGLQHSIASTAYHRSICGNNSHPVRRRDCCASTEHNTSTSTFQQQHADQQAQQILMSMVVLAHTTSSLKPQFKPQSYLLPPWLGAQPGNARGFVRVESPGLLNPGLTLTNAQVLWLSWGCLSGHSGGVFVSHCTSSPRSRQACGFMAAVVINKQLLAELYLPSGCTAPGRWDHLYHPVATTTAANPPVVVDDRSTHCQASESADSEAANAATAVQFELWVSHQVAFNTEDDAGTAEAAPAGAPAAAGQRARSRRRQHGRHNSSAVRSSSSRASAAGSSGVPWREVHALLIQCISSNAARARAVTATAVVPPGTAAAALVENHLGQLVAAESPVLDLRRFQYTAAPGVRATAAQLAEATCRPCAGSRGPAQCMQAAHPFWEPLSNRCCHDTTHASQSRAAQGFCSQTSCSIVAMQQQWRCRTAAVQTALSTAVAEAAGQGAAGLDAAAATAAHLGDDGLAEVLAAVVKQLHVLAPEVQVLVLPVILPGGRVGQRVPGGKTSSSRLSAPRLLSFNVPFLVPLRYEWDRLQQLKQVLLVVGPPPALPVASTASVTDSGCSTHECPCSVISGSSSSCSNSKGSNTGCRASGQHMSACNDSGMQLLQRLQHRHSKAGTESTTGPLVRGVFSQQQLEQAWRQQVLAQDVEHQGRQPALQEQQLQQWDDEAWFEQQRGQQQQKSEVKLPAGEAGSELSMQSEHNSRRGLQQTPGVSLWGANVALPGYALEAVQGMLLSCMDRLAPAATP